MKKVLVVGAGQLGSRHLQGIKKAESNIEVYALDTNKSSLNTALVRWDEILENKKRELNILHTISSIPENIDILIVATSSNVRFQVTEAIIERSNVKYIIFEKVLFQKEEEYFKVGEVFPEKILYIGILHGITYNTKRYNDCLSKNKGFISLESIGRDSIMSDYHDINSKGHLVIFGLIKQRLFK